MIRPCESPVDLRCCLGAHLLQELWIWGPHVLFPVSTYNLEFGQSLSVSGLPIYTNLHTCDVFVASCSPCLPVADPMVCLRLL